MAITAWSAKVFSRADLCVRERTNFRASNKNDPDGNALAEQRRDKYSPNTGSGLSLP